MLLKEISFSSPQENILFDEVLLQMAEEGKSGETLRFWESRELFVVLGRISRQEEDLETGALCKDGIAVLRRSSGGGTVLQGRGCLNYTLVLSKARDGRISDVRASYQFILEKIIAAFKLLGIETVFYPTSDVALAASRKKISGNAQKRMKKFILHHGTILYDFDLSKVSRYLKIPKDVPEYRRGRSHADFVANVPLAVGDIKKAISGVFAAGPRTDLPTDEESACLRNLLAAKNLYLSFPDH